MLRKGEGKEKIECDGNEVSKENMLSVIIRDRIRNEEIRSRVICQVSYSCISGSHSCVLG